jgi:hypothetical protein
LCRDEEAVLRGLEDPWFEHRINAVAAAAFLGTERLRAAVGRMREVDIDSLVRASAAWACRTGLSKIAEFS